MSGKEKPAQGKKRIYGSIALVAAVLLAAEVLWAQPHHHDWWHRLPGADLLLGFFGAWLLIFLAKIVMAKVLQRPVTYYEDGEETAPMNEEKGGGRHDS